MSHASTKGSDDDQIAALAVGKTVAFVLYSVIAVVASTAATMIGPISELSPRWQEWALLAIWISLELLLSIGVIKGVLPGTTREAEGFSEAQAAAAFTLLSAAVMLWPEAGSEVKGIVQGVVNAGLAITLLVYFLTKTVLTRRPAWGVLAVAVLPVAQLFVVKPGPFM